MSRELTSSRPSPKEKVINAQPSPFDDSGNGRVIGMGATDDDAEFDFAVQYSFSPLESRLGGEVDERTER